jgi:hypothetical protein
VNRGCARHHNGSIPWHEKLAQFPRFRDPPDLQVDPDIGAAFEPHLNTLGARVNYGLSTIANHLDRRWRSVIDFDHFFGRSPPSMTDNAGKAQCPNQNHHNPLHACFAPEALSFITTIVPLDVYRQLPAKISWVWLI